MAGIFYPLEIVELIFQSYLYAMDSDFGRMDNLIEVRPVTTFFITKLRCAYVATL